MRILERPAAVDDAIDSEDVIAPPPIVGAPVTSKCVVDWGVGSDNPADDAWGDAIFVLKYCTLLTVTR